MFTSPGNWQWRRSGGRGRQAWGISDNNGGVSGGRGIYYVSERSETTTEAVGARRRAQGIYDNNEGVGGGRWSRRLQQQQQQQQRRRRRRIYDTSKWSETTTEAAAAWRRSWWIVNDDGVSTFLAISPLRVTLSLLCLITVSFWYFYHKITFFRSLQERLSVLQSCEKYFCTKFTLTLRMYPLRTGE